MLSAAAAAGLAKGGLSPGALVHDAALPSQLRIARPAASLHAFRAACWKHRRIRGLAGLPVPYIAGPASASCIYAEDAVQYSHVWHLALS